MKNKKAIILFLIITLILSSLCYYVRIAGGEKAAGMTAILMFCPTISALIVRAIYFRGEKILERFEKSFFSISSSFNLLLYYF